MSKHSERYNDKSMPNIILSREKPKPFILKHSCPLSSLFSKIVLEDLVLATRQEKPNWKKLNYNYLKKLRYT